MTKILTNKSNVDLNYPICRPTLNLDFSHERLDPRITFTRGSTGTRINRFGYIETVSANRPRFDYDPFTKKYMGLLIEEQRTNIIDYSSGIGLGAWSVTGTVTRNTTETLAPDGTYTAAKWSLVPGTTYTGGASAINFFGSYTPGQTYSLSFFIKSGGSSATTFAIIANSNPFGSQTFWVDSIPVNPNTVFFFTRSSGNIPVGQISNLGTFQRIAYPNGWTKVVWSGFTMASGSNSRDLMIYWTGYAGVTGTPFSTFYLWGFQLEVGSSPLSYIPTAGSATTRSADVATISGSNFSSWYNPTEGTIVVTGQSDQSKTIASASGSIKRFAELSDGTSVNAIYSGYLTPRSQFLTVSSSIISNNISNLSLQSISSSPTNRIVASDPFGGYPILTSETPHGLNVNDVVRVLTSSLGLLVDTDYYVTRVDSLTRFSLGTSIGVDSSFTFSTSASIPFYVYSSLNKKTKIASAYSANNFQQATNGVLGTRDINGIVPSSINQLNIGRSADASLSAYLNGTISNLTYYSRRLSENQLQLLTQ